MAAIPFIPIAELDPIVFANHLIEHDLLPLKSDSIYNHESRAGIAQPHSLRATRSGVQTGTFKGTQKVLTAVYSRLLDSHAIYMNLTGVEVYLPRGKTDLDTAREIYNWSIPTEQDNYPPHLARIPYKDSVLFTQIFNVLRIAETAPLLARVIPDRIIDFFYDDPGNADTIEAVFRLNQTSRSGPQAQPNIGDRDDWYTDAVFAQQQLTGTNPVTLKIIPPFWLKGFITEAGRQGKQAAIDVLTKADPENSFYVQDYSWFRDAIGLEPSSIIKSDDGQRRTGASVALFQLDKTGVLHPLAICLDFKGSFSESVTMFNSRLKYTDDASRERDDWPWRYAKTVFQCADWHRHEIGVHLTESHLIEEATIVGANRSFPEDHIVYRLLSPHWLKTLSVNSAARSTLLPNVIIPIAGMEAKSVYALVRYNYQNFDFAGHYIPNDLKRRGFPEDQLQQGKFHNCAYARDISLFWSLLRKFVSTILHSVYPSDASLTADNHVAGWCEEMRNPDKADMPGFPDIRTVDQLIDAVTACIHIASPLHSAVNYLQNYYYAFVIHKPSALYSDIPTTIEALESYEERNLIDALPIHHARDWLLGSHIPWLLSYQVSDNQNILTWAATLANTVAGTMIDTVLSSAARTLYQDMLELATVIQMNSDARDDTTTAYTVLAPKQVAVSILI